VDIQGVVRLGPWGASADIAARVVDQDVDVAEFLDGPLDQGRYLPRIGEIGGQEGGAPAQGPDLLGHRQSGWRFPEFGRGPLVHVVDEHVGAGRRQVERVAAAQAAAGPRDQG